MSDKSDPSTLRRLKSPLFAPVQFISVGSTKHRASVFDDEFGLQFRSQI